MLLKGYGISVKRDYINSYIAIIIAVEYEGFLTIVWKST